MALELPFGIKVLNPDQPIDAKYFNSAGNPYTSTAQMLSETAGIRHRGLVMLLDTGVEYWFQDGITDPDLVVKTGGGGGGGDMILADTQTNTGAKTFLDNTLLMRNVANTFSSRFTNTNTAARTYTLPDAAGTVALTSDLSGWLTGTLTGDATIIGGGTLDINLGTNPSKLGLFRVASQGSNTLLTLTATRAAQLITDASSPAYSYTNLSTGDNATITLGGAGEVSRMVFTANDPAGNNGILSLSTTSGFVFTSNAFVLKYAGDYSSRYDVTSVVHKGYIDSRLLGQPLAAPTGAEVSKSIRWNAGGTAWEYYTPSGGGGGIANTAANNELAKSDGTDIGPSGIFSTTAGSLILGNSSESVTERSITVASSSPNVDLKYISKGIGGHRFDSYLYVADLVIAANALTSNDQVGVVISSSDATIRASQDATTNITALTLLGTFANSTYNNGGGVIVKGNYGYLSSGDGNGGSVTIQSGQRRVAGSGVDGNITLDSLTGKIILTSVPADADNASDVILFRSAATGNLEKLGIGSGLSISGSNLIASGGSGDVATDAIWDAAGDLAVGSGANTSVRLARGTAGQVLVVNAGGTDIEWGTPAGGGDVTLAGTQTLTNKTISPASNTIRYPIRQQGGTTYSLVAGDENYTIEFTSASPVAVTLPNSLATDFTCNLVNYGGGVITISATGSLESAGTTIETQYHGAVVKHKGSNVWSAIGALGTAASVTETIVFAVGNSTAVTTGGKTTTRIICPYTGTITGWKMIADQSTTTTCDIWKDTVIPDNADSITASAKPALSAVEFNSSTTLTGWTTSVTAGDILMLEVESNNNATYISVMLTIQVAL